ncbi:MAG: hypothetical protein Q8K05_08775 [Polaromonas sp.]|nr:hypothetical protein [Polaromonas sp.]MDP2256134.1 hypothetical protein [Polaromonas sp.]MDP3708973.1 hypothetical protein [Polaromonas sp.]
MIACGSQATRFAMGQRVGIPWLGQTCGSCPHAPGRRCIFQSGGRFAAANSCAGLCAARRQ